MATDYVRKTIFDQSEIMLAAILGRKFAPLTALRIIRAISDLDISRPYDAIDVVLITSRLHQHGYDANEANQVVWALRERAK
jgi:hypothetical protein